MVVHQPMSSRAPMATNQNTRWVATARPAHTMAPSPARTAAVRTASGRVRGGAAWPSTRPAPPPDGAEPGEDGGGEDGERQVQRRRVVALHRLAHLVLESLRARGADAVHHPVEEHRLGAAGTGP